MHKVFTACFAILLLPQIASAQDLVSQTEALQAALNQNDTALALTLSDNLYDASQNVKDPATAGYAAYVKAGLLELQGDYVAAAKSYGLCDEAYDEARSAAQSIQCLHKSALAYRSGSKSGQTVDALEMAAKRLEAIGQEKSALASQVYILLAEEIRPGKLERGKRLDSKRIKAAEYADMAATALETSGLRMSPDYAAAQFLKGIAYEDAEEFSRAIDAYELAVATYEALPDTSEETLRTIKSRLSIASFGGDNESGNNTVDITDEEGRPVTLTIKKRKKVKIPRINGNQIVDGARVRALMTLLPDGSVDKIDILESLPSPEFGDAFTKAATRWTFALPDGTPPADIPPFEYSMIFYVKRR